MLQKNEALLNIIIKRRLHVNRIRLFQTGKFIVFLLIIHTLFFSTGCKKNDSLTDGNIIFRDITPSEAYALIQENQGNMNFVILDVRTSAEYNSGYIEGAIDIDYYSGNFETQLQAQDKNKIYLIYCHSGNRSDSAHDLMRDLGFREVYNLSGGITRWISEGYPIVVPDKQGV